MDAEKLARLQKSVRIGGKGTPRRKVKRTHKSNEGDDKKLQAALNKINAQTIPQIEQVNMLKEDGKMLSFNRARVQASVPANTFAIYGTPVEKEMTEFLPEVLSSMGPENLEQLRRITEQMKASGAAGSVNPEAEDEQIPDLVEGETFEDKVD
ncbi:nascent polypeptide-associated complex subunit beta-1 [Trichomonascus vanleenenianus]|uniref:nascent polypeptide-associated complex subunit family protein n=1 Tax=Trichomonascus vanleenenianus TaxID=2268995 RepID=UPI003ECA28DE